MAPHRGRRGLRRGRARAEAGRAGSPSFRPGERAALPGPSPEPSRLGARRPPGRPPHHRRLLVDRGARRRPREGVRRGACGSQRRARCRRDRATPSSRAGSTTWSPAREGERHWAYWRQQLAGPLPVLDLPTDFARPAVQSYKGAIKHFDLDPTLTRAVVALGESRGISLYTTLLAAFQVFLGRYSGQDDILVGSPVAGRTRPGSRGADRLLRQPPADAGRPLGEPDRSTNTWAASAGPSPKVWNIKTSPSACSSIGSRGTPIPAGRPLFQVMFAHQKAPAPR